MINTITTDNVRRFFAFVQSFVFLWLLQLPTIVFATPLFDVHLHYNQADVDVVSPAEIVSILKRNKVRYAVVTSRPPELVRQLYQQAPDMIVPMLGVYQTLEDKSRWYKDKDLPKRVEAALKKGSWKALGELHIFAAQRNQPVFRKIIQLAVDYQVPLIIHGDPAVIDTVYSIAPNHPVIWAHAGTFPYADLLADYLKRYPRLHVDLSVRDDRIAPGGKLSDDWYTLLLTFSDRFMIGVDTYSTGRWKRFELVTAKIRHWLSQLPPDIAQQIAFDNADKMLHRSANAR